MQDDCYVCLFVVDAATGAVLMTRPKGFPWGGILRELPELMELDKLAKAIAEELVAEGRVDTPVSIHSWYRRGGDEHGLLMCAYAVRVMSRGRVKVPDCEEFRWVEKEEDLPVDLHWFTGGVLDHGSLLRVGASLGFHKKL